MSHAHEILQEVQGEARVLRDKIPDVFSGYAELGRATFVEGALSRKTKELIALAIAVTRECDGCIAAHAKGAGRTGATHEEVAEALGVTILMNGGPGTVWAPRAYAAYEEFLAES